MSARKIRRRQFVFTSCAAVFARRTKRTCPSRWPIPLQDIRVDRATAEAYVVRAGEYIQIIDVAGRQCTDFQCFSARSARQGARASARRHHDALADGPKLSASRPLLQGLRSEHAAAGRGGARHGRPPRRLRARLSRALLRRPGLSRPRQLHGQFQRRARALRHRPAQRLDGDQLLLQYRHRCA